MPRHVGRPLRTCPNNDKTDCYNTKRTNTHNYKTLPRPSANTRDRAPHGGARLSSPASFAKKMRLANAVRWSYWTLQVAETWNGDDKNTEAERDEKTHDFLLRFLLVKISGFFNDWCFSTVKRCRHTRSLREISRSELWNVAFSTDIKMINVSHCGW